MNKFQDTFSIDEKNRINRIDIGDVRDVAYQNILISEFLTKQVKNIDEKTVHVFWGYVIRHVLKINYVMP